MIKPPTKMVISVIFIIFNDGILKGRKTLQRWEQHGQKHDQNMRITSSVRDLETITVGVPLFRETVSAFLGDFIFQFSCHSLMSNEE